MKGKLVFLRSLESSDVDFLYTWENATENWKISATTTPFSKKVLKDYVNSVQDIYADKQLRLMICSNVDSAPLGTIDLFDFDPKNQRTGIGILIANKENRHKGYANEALRLIIDYAKNTLSLKQVYCNILETNDDSIKLFEKNGFKLAGKKRDWVKSEENWESELIFQLILR